jgi:hypothetical protein
VTNKKRTVVTIERRERTVVRGNSGDLVAWCARCGAEVQLVTPGEAAALAQEAAASNLARLGEPCELHLPEAGDGAPPVRPKLLPARSHDS